MNIYMLLTLANANSKVFECLNSIGRMDKCRKSIWPGDVPVLVHVTTGTIHRQRPATRYLQSRVM